MSNMPSQPPRQPPDGAVHDPGQGPWDGGADTSWQLAISLITAWRSNGGDRHALAARLADAAGQGREAVAGQAAAERAVDGLTTVADIFIELYADRLGVSPDDALQDASAHASNKSIVS